MQESQFDTEKDSSNGATFHEVTTLSRSDHVVMGGGISSENKENRYEVTPAEV